MQCPLCLGRGRLLIGGQSKRCKCQIPTESYSRSRARYAYVCCSALFKRGETEWENIHLAIVTCSRYYTPSEMAKFGSLKTDTIRKILEGQQTLDGEL